MTYRLVLFLSFSFPLYASQNASAHGDASGVSSPELDLKRTINQPSTHTDVPDTPAEADRKTSSARGANTPIPGTVPHTNYDITPAPSGRDISYAEPVTFYTALRKQILAAQTLQSQRSNIKMNLNKLLLNAAHEGYADLVTLAIDSGAEINTIDGNGLTPLHAAVTQLPHPDSLISADGDHEQPRKKDTPDYYAVIETLLAKGAILDIAATERVGTSIVQFNVVDTALHNEQTFVIYLFAKYRRTFPNSAPTQNLHGRLAHRESFDVMNVQDTVSEQLAKALQIGEQHRLAEEQNLPLRYALITKTIPDLPKVLIPLIQDYAGPFIPFDAVEIIKQIHQPDQAKKCCCTIS